MFRRYLFRLLPLAVSLVVVLGWRTWLVGQQPAGDKSKTSAVDSNRFEFEVIQSFDARYEGDTPGHIGRYGGLTDRRPRAALGDAVFRGEEKIGVVTGLTWNRGQGSLEVEFHPTDQSRISVGDVVWLALGGGESSRGK